MANIKVVVVSQTKLELAEDAKKGDQIDLSTLNQIDQSFLSSYIEGEKNKELERRVAQAKTDWEKQKSYELDSIEKQYESKLADIKRVAQDEKLKEVQALNAKVNELQTQLTVSKENQADFERATKAEIEKEYQKEILKLQNDYQTLKTGSEEKLKSTLESREKELQLQYEKKISELENQIKQSDNAKQVELMKQKNENLEELNSLKQQLETQKLALENKKNAALNKEKEGHKEEIDSLKEKIHSLELKIADNEAEKEKALNKANEEKNSIQVQLDTFLRQKGSLGVKLIGENLEKWCTNEFENAQSLGGFPNCTWTKDNIAVKEADDLKGTKGDFIFRINNADEPVEITSALLEMKSENPESKNQKHNSDHYEKLNKDREKKNCEYAILVSELDMNSENDVPIKKVTEYKNMYVVRPQYMLTFLSILLNLGQKYSYLLNKNDEETKRLKSSQELIDEFEKLKETYLDKPLVDLEKEVGEIRKTANTIVDSGNKIIASADKIINTKLSTIKEKINRLTIEKLSKTVKKLDKYNQIDSD